MQNGPNGQYVFVVKPDQTVEMRRIKVARTEGDDTVVASGLKPGDQVVTVGQLRLAPGTRVDAGRPAAGVVNIAALFVRRPVMTVLVMIGILIFGLIGYRLLPVNALPNVDFPTIQVLGQPAGREPGNDGFRGRDAARKAVLDDRRHRLDDFDVDQRQSTSITLQFALERNIDAAAQDVQSAIAAAARSLPSAHADAADAAQGQPGGLFRYCSSR